ncbi:Uncharacterised protein [Mycobacteroides abscessus subsp. abscessus]|nr:Uncharacterised protein [Mycobacteroides abscessus subsp. abscessus]
MSITENLDATIASAVKAQIEAKVLEALSGGEFFEKYVHSVLYAKVEIADPKDRYKKISVNFIDNAIAGVVRAATQDAIKVAVNEQREEIQEHVRKAVKRQTDKFAQNVVEGLVEATNTDYRFNVQIGVPKRGDY